MNRASHEQQERIGKPRAPVKLYATRWCGDCRRSKRLLDLLGVAYEWIDLSRDEEAQREAVRLSGRHAIPVVALPNGRILVEPSDPELSRALIAAGLLPN